MERDPISDIGNPERLSISELEKGISVLNKYIAGRDELIVDVLEQLAKTPKIQGIECKAAVRAYNDCLKRAEDMIVLYEAELAKR